MTITVPRPIPVAPETNSHDSNSHDTSTHDGEIPAGVTVHARDVRRAFNGRAVLGGLDLDVRPGEFVALLGASGSGKSTFLRVLAGLDPEATGSVHVPDRVSFVFQEPRLLPWRSVWRNVALGLDLPKREARERALAALGEVGLGGHVDAWPVTLSGGEAQRAALARSLVRDPQLLLLDEPFGALDALTRIKMHGLLADLCRRHRPAVVLVTHDVDEALLLADRALVLRADADGGSGNGGTDQAAEAGGALIVHDIPIDLGGHRLRADPRFVELRHQLLHELGVDDDDELIADPAVAS